MTIFGTMGFTEVIKVKEIRAQIKGEDGKTWRTWLLMNQGEAFKRNSLCWHLDLGLQPSEL